MPNQVQRVQAAKANYRGTALEVRNAALRRASMLLALILCLQAAHAAQSWPMTGKVIHVEDGDTLTLLQSDYSKVSVRLSDIDAPETSHGRGRPGQPYSQASKQSLLALAGGQQATATCYERDRWERPVCTVFVNGQDVNAEQLRRGMAWVSRINRAYVRNPLSAASEAQAKAAQLGLWSAQGPRPVPPWEWRRDCWKNKVCDGAGE